MGHETWDRDMGHEKWDMGHGYLQTKWSIIEVQWWIFNIIV